MNEGEPGVVVVRGQYDERGSCDDIGMTTAVNVRLDRALGQRTVGIENPGGAVVDCAVSIADVPDDPCP